ncbi:MAG TPA: hypothetical protein VEX86_27675 [Longimicrobium sp.]|nr:hypothetical protein [Longimicrobium sp.]
MRTTLCSVALVLLLREGAAAQQDSTRTPAARDSAAAADSAAIVRELEAMQARGDTSPATAGAAAGPVQRLLPDISVVGDFVADLSPEGSTQEGGERFGVREVEIAIQAAVDPYFRGDVFLGISDLEGIAIEQAYLTTTSLPWALEARIGRFLMPFGKQTTTHRHDLHTVEYPHVIQTFLGPEGLKGTGLYASRVFSPLGFYQELQATVVDRLAFESEEELRTAEPVNRRLSGLGYSARLRNYVDLSEAANVELSFSAMTGKVAHPLALDEGDEVNAFATRQTTVGADLTYRWRPLRQGLYRSLIVQGEVMRQLNKDPGETVQLPDGTTATFEGPRRGFTGAYAFGRYQLSRRTFVGARYDWVEDPTSAGDALTAASGYLQFFPSEFSKLTAAFERLNPALGEGVNRILLQATFALGPHKPHPF